MTNDTDNRGTMADWDAMCNLAGKRREAAHFWLRWNRKPVVGIRLGKNANRLFSERHQGTRGIKRRFFYFLGGRVTVIFPNSTPA